jgi:hypothetical protein
VLGDTLAPPACGAGARRGVGGGLVWVVDPLSQLIAGTGVALVERRFQWLLSGSTSWQWFFEHGDKGRHAQVRSPFACLASAWGVGHGMAGYALMLRAASALDHESGPGQAFGSWEQQQACSQCLSNA